MLRSDEFGHVEFLSAKLIYYYTFKDLHLCTVKQITINIYIKLFFISV